MAHEPYKKSRSRLWTLLWLTGVVWLLSILGLPSGRVPWWLFITLSVVAFLAAWWINLRMVRMTSRRKAGRCWKCNYDQAGLDSPKCPECGTDV